ncbi:MAG: hypothetical protein H6733_16790 [Alphaproteobacteria bacterium]|nr:hypothetical protein [Alphaproteobacteria bacterium]
MRSTLLLASVASGLLLASCGDPERPVLSDVLIGHCEYVSPFTNEPECRDYLGSWSAEDATADCTKLKSEIALDTACPSADVLGWCLTDDDGEQLRIHILGTDTSRCGSSKTGCQFFGGGYWDPSALCAGEDELLVLDNAWPQPERVCMDPLPGEPPGQSEGGQVCTWEIISGATEEGRVFSDYASCDTVRLQRPYSPVPPNRRSLEADSRMDDTDYVADVRWVQSQLKSSACVCCHDRSAPSGPSVFDLDTEDNLFNQFNDRGIAMGAGWISTVGFGAWPPEQNNGFERSDLDDPNDSIMPTTDMDRMIALFEREASHRGMKRSDYAGEQYGAAILDELRLFRPSACTEDEGVGADGRLRWLPGRARYVYVLEADADTPTVPPNLDRPEGTLWRLDLKADAYPVGSESIVYGEVPSEMVQRIPESGKPPALRSGRQYYLYVTADITFPISRCLFTAP